MEPSDLVLKYAPWSVTKADTAAECPKRFDFEYIQKKPKAPPGFHANVGKAAHKVLEYALNDINLTRAYESMLLELSLTTEEKEKVTSFLPSIETFLRRFQKYTERYPVQEKITERKLALDITRQPAQFWDNDKVFFRGIVDLTLLLKNKDAVIFDHKTGRPKGMNVYRNQFDAYSLLCKVNYPQVVNIQTGLNFLQLNEVRFDQLIDASDSDVLWIRLLNLLNKAAEKLQDLDTTIKGPWCRWCSYTELCPANNNGKNT